MNQKNTLHNKIFVHYAFFCIDKEEGEGYTVITTDRFKNQKQSNAGSLFRFEASNIFGNQGTCVRFHIFPDRNAKCVKNGTKDDNMSFFHSLITGYIKKVCVCRWLEQVSSTRYFKAEFF